MDSPHRIKPIRLYRFSRSDPKERLLELRAYKSGFLDVCNATDSEFWTDYETDAYRVGYTVAIGIVQEEGRNSLQHYLRTFEKDMAEAI